MAVNLLEEQYRKSQKVRRKNKQEERLLQHDIDSRRGMNDVHRYRMEIFNREQKEISKELDRIRMGIKRNLSMAPNDWLTHSPESMKQMRSGASAFHPNSKTIGGSYRTPRHRVSAQSLTHYTSHRRNDDQEVETLDKVVLPSEETLDDVGNDGKKSRSESENDGDNDDDEDDDCYRSDEKESIPDPNILKVIMDGIVGHWEQNVLQTITNREMEQKVLSPRISHDKTPDSNLPGNVMISRRYQHRHLEKDIGQHRKAVSGTTQNPKLSLQPKSYVNSSRHSSVKRRQYDTSSAISEKQTDGKQQAPKLSKDTVKSPGSLQTQPAGQGSRWGPTVADHHQPHTSGKGRAVSKGHAKSDNQTQTQSPSRSGVRKEEKKRTIGESMNSRYSRNKQQTLQESVMSSASGGQYGMKVTSEKTLPRLHLEAKGVYSARENTSNYLEVDDHVQPTLSSRSDGYPMKGRQVADDGNSSRSSSVLDRRLERAWVDHNMDIEDQLVMHCQKRPRNPRRRPANLYKNPKLHIHKDDYRREN